MKHPQHGIKSTRPKHASSKTIQESPLFISVPPPNMAEAQYPAYFPQRAVPTLIDDNCDETIANMFCFGAFAGQHCGVMYNNLMGNFPFMLFDGSIWFVIMYHYEANAIMAML
jgi:hypothetical protein